MKWVVRGIDSRNEHYRTLYEGDMPQPGEQLMLETVTLTERDVDLTKYDIISIGLSDVAVIVFCHRKGMDNGD